MHFLISNQIKMSSKGIIVVGSLHHDIIVDASHQPVKGETLHGSRWYPKFGGKGGNQAVAASLLGTQSKIVSAIGDDNFGSVDLLGCSNNIEHAI